MHVEDLTRFYQKRRWQDKVNLMIPYTQRDINITMSIIHETIVCV